MSPRRRGALAWVCLLALGPGACASKAPGAASGAPAEPAAGGAEGPPAAEESEHDLDVPGLVGDDVEVMGARVDAAWVELTALEDASRKEAVAAGAPAPAGAADRCERIRGLADEICRLSDRMCTMAAEHPGEARYADACARSGQTCAQAREAAERCPAA